MDFNVWEILLYTLLVTHITIVSVTIFLHRSQTHRSVDLHPLVAHFFRFWLWLTTGIVTKEWVAVHRKHHATCDTLEDPHSPQTHGLPTVLLQGSELYVNAARDVKITDRYGFGTPEDWVEKEIYSRRSFHGVILLLAFNILAFGIIGVSIWAVQMLWIPVTAAGLVNGVGHWWGYRNFETTDASHNFIPWGILIGGEELHNNHHNYPTSAKLSVHSGEFDIGWAYIKTFQFLGLAKVKRVHPSLQIDLATGEADTKMLDAIISNRFAFMSIYGERIRQATFTEQVREELNENIAERIANLKVAQKWLHRDEKFIPAIFKVQILNAVQGSPLLSELIAMREQLRNLWEPSNTSSEDLVRPLHLWLDQADHSENGSLKEFAIMLRRVHT
ncbi:acyl-CoA desaturase [Massilia forsythiae]|uniref:Acyl-CoA desaturase n=2 Tax=Massilia forsythiae TaxID=2728020 RepID=A0A7Z2W353_9BURK|nr:acyl-CoA desaturase [Massilia forsythiae]